MIEKKSNFQTIYQKQVYDELPYCLSFYIDNFQILQPL